MTTEHGMNIMGWVGSVLVWLTFVYQIRQIIVVRHRRKHLKEILLAGLAQQTGLSVTQVCAALDAGEAMFEQRVREMGGHVR